MLKLGIIVGGRLKVKKTVYMSFSTDVIHGGHTELLGRQQNLEN